MIVFSGAVVFITFTGLVILMIAGNSDLGADPAGGVALEVRGFEEKFARSFKKLLPTSQSSAQSPGPQSATVGGGGERFVAPPRPPKPAHLSSDHPSHNYLNLDQVPSSAVFYVVGQVVPLDFISMFHCHYCHEVSLV